MQPLLHYSEIIRGSKRLYSVSNKPNHFKSGYNFTTYGKFTDTT